MSLSTVGSELLFARCWWQGDNTVKELRNSFTGKMASLLTSASYFNCVSHHHLMVGHTHEDVGSWDCKSSEISEILPLSPFH